jgi:hypothetical protein
MIPLYLYTMAAFQVIILLIFNLLLNILPSFTHAFTSMDQQFGDGVLTWLPVVIGTNLK